MSKAYHPSSAARGGEITTELGMASLLYTNNHVQQPPQQGSNLMDDLFRLLVVEIVNLHQ
jgi:hypothetical protein